MIIKILLTLSVLFVVIVVITWFADGYDWKFCKEDIGDLFKTAFNVMFALLIIFTNEKKLTI